MVANDCTGISQNIEQVVCLALKYCQALEILVKTLLCFHLRSLLGQSGEEDHMMLLRMLMVMVMMVTVLYSADALLTCIVSYRFISLPESSPYPAPDSRQSGRGSSWESLHAKYPRHPGNTAAPRRS